MRVLRAALIVVAVAVSTVAARTAPADEVHGDVGGATAGDPHATPAITAGGPTGEHHGRDYNQPPLALEPQLLIWSLVLFVLFVLAAKRLAWQPLIAGLNAREERVTRALAEARAARAQAEQLLREHEQRIGAATEEVRAIVGGARREAEQSKVEIIAAAEHEAEQIRDRALAEIAAAREQLLSELSTTVDQYAETTSGRLLEGLRS
jgi:F-type H+-transporting ATPase subunit b